MHAYLLPVRVIMNGMAYRDLCEMEREFCEHGLVKSAGTQPRAGGLLTSPNGIAHFSGCPHKGDDPGLQEVGGAYVPCAWKRLGNGEQLQATGGRSPGLTAGALRLVRRDLVSAGIDSPDPQG